MSKRVWKWWLAAVVGVGATLVAIKRIGKKPGGRPLMETSGRYSGALVTQEEQQAGEVRALQDLGYKVSKPKLREYPRRVG